jgi:Hemerythrin HHE cation binding domain
MDPFELLKKDHKKVSELFKKIEATTGKAKLGVFKQIKSELDLHSHIEETILYPALEKAKETRDLTLEAYEEHKVVKDLLGQLAAAKTPSDEWQAKLTVLQENVEHHVKEEENDLFDKANDVLTGDEAEELGDRMQAEKIKKGGSAAAPEVKAEKPGLIATFARALGLASSSPAAIKKSSQKKLGRQAGGAKSPSAKSSGSASNAKKKAGRGATTKSRAAGKRARTKSVAAKTTTAKKRADTSRSASTRKTRPGR